MPFLNSLGFDRIGDFFRWNNRQNLYSFISFGLMILTVLMMWKGLMVVTNSESPIVVVISGSMEPAFQRGDVLLLTNYKEDPIRVGDIIVFKLKERDILIVHRVLKLHEKKNGSIKILTKGDNNSVDDRSLYPPGKLWLTKKNIVGRIRGFIPYFGWTNVTFNKYPESKYVILGILALFVFALVDWQ